MTRNFSKTIDLFTLLACLISAHALHASEAMQWPAGPNVCQGTWSYSEYQSCEDASHGPDTNRPIVGTDGERCGYEKTQNSCWHGREYEGYFDMEQEKLPPRPRPYSDADLQSYCDNKARALPMAGHQLLGPVSVLPTYRGLACPDGSSSCQPLMFGAIIQCRIVIDHQIFGQSDECGAYIDDQARPKTCVVGYPNISKRSAACPTSNLTTGRGTDASSLMNVNWRYNFSCSTGDDLPAETGEQVQKKYAFLVNRIQQTLDAGSPDFAPLLNGLAALLEKRSSSLNVDQIAYATKVTNSEIKLSKIADGVAFDVASECVSAGSDRSRF
jgi:hypothetical protein